MVNFDLSKYSLITLDEVHSTNSYVLENLAYLDNRSVVFSTRQTNGRGRFNRKWIGDNSDNIYMSLLLKSDDFSDFPLANLTQYLSLAICIWLENDFDLKPNIKWPNDILINNAKLSGILAETSCSDNKISAVVLGLGLNVNMDENTLSNIDQKAVSLKVLKGESFNCELLLRNILDCFFKNYDDFVNFGFPFIKDEYIKRCSFLGKNILISENGIKKPYFAKSVDNHGLLTAIDENNNVCKIITGDVLC